MLDTQGCNLPAAHRILLQIGIGRLHGSSCLDYARTTSSTLLHSVLPVDKKLAMNFLRNLDYRQLSLTPALEAVMSQYTQFLTQLDHPCYNGQDLQRNKTREFPKLAFLTCSNFWQRLALINQQKQSRCCAELSLLVSIASQLQNARKVALSADLQLPIFSEGPHTTVSALLSGHTYASNAQAVALSALIACFAFDCERTHCFKLCATYFAAQLGLCLTSCRVLF